MSEELEQYVIDHSVEELPLLKQLSREANVKLLHGRMVSGHIQGRLLSAVAHMIKPDRILEIGTYVGYSAICLAEGLPENGKLITIDKDDEIEDMARSYLERCDNAGKIDFIIGDALKIIPGLDDTFNLVFIDGDKRQYNEYYDAVFDKVPSGGFILADNTLWNGKLLHDVASNDHMSKGLVAFNDRIVNDKRVETFMLPLRDGITFIRKL